MRGVDSGGISPGRIPSTERKGPGTQSSDVIPWESNGEQVNSDVAAVGHNLNIQCYECGNKKHIAANCPNKGKGKGRKGGGGKTRFQLYTKGFTGTPAMTPVYPKGGGKGKGESFLWNPNPT
eukprot:1667848-Karenia_brevis.AAC.1